MFLEIVFFSDHTHGYSQEKIGMLLHP